MQAQHDWDSTQTPILIDGTLAIVSSSATNWPSPAYSPDTGLFYLPENNSLGVRYLINDDPRGSMGLGGTSGGGGVSTGGSTFAGDGAGNIVAFDPGNGKPLWHSRVGNVSGAPQTYMLDGKQYLLVAVGDALAAFAVYAQ